MSAVRGIVRLLAVVRRMCTALRATSGNATVVCLHWAALVRSAQRRRGLRTSRLPWTAPGTPVIAALLAAAACATNALPFDIPSLLERQFHRAAFPAGRGR